MYNLIQGAKKTAEVAAGIMQGAAAAGQQVQDTVATGLAKLYTLATLPPGMVPSGAISIPSIGSVVPVSKLTALSFDSSQNLGFFGYMGITYQVSPQQWDSQGNLIATEVPDFGLINPSGGWS